MKSFAAAILLLLAIHQLTFADQGHPVAIRHWPGGGFTLETMWDLQIGMGLNDESAKVLKRKTDFDLESLEPGKSAIVNRWPNKPDVKVNFGASKLSDNSVAARHSEDGRKWVKVDGVSIFNINAIQADQLDAYLKKVKPNFDSIFEKADTPVRHFVIATNEKFTREALEEIRDAFHPELMIVNANIDSLGDQQVTKIGHNTIAVSFSKEHRSTPKLVSLATTEYEMSDEVKTLFEKKEASQRASAEFFASLTVEQLNFRPANGTHTPRWNTEHMMGRELVFFSQIYNAVDPSIPVMNLNPKQMPKDYEFAHGDWDGKEEARQTQRVERFTRRFAYLLDGMKLDQKAPGSRFWTPRALLRQMERHYNEHTGNVRKKMKLPGWPK